MQKKHLFLAAVGICFLMALESQGATGWTQQTSHTIAKLGGTYFINENTGFVCGDSGVVLKTRDGGTTWTRMYVGSYEQLMYIHAIDSNRAYFTTWNGGKVIKTENGGGTWSVIAPAKDSMAARGIWFTNSQTGFFCIGIPYSNSKILRTINSGTSWDTVCTANQWISHIHFPDAGHGYATGGRGTVFKTIDSGATWTASLPGGQLFLSGVFFLNKDTGYVGGVGGITNGTYTNMKILKTTDGGSNWTTVNTDVTAISLFFVNDSTGYLIGGISSTVFHLYKTQNGGITWQMIDLGTNLNQNGFWFPSPNVGYVAGDSGTIFKYQGTTAVREDKNLFKHAATGIDVITLAPHKLQVKYSLSSEEVKNVTFTMYSIQGDCIWKENINGKRLTAGSNTAIFHIGSHLAAGMYVFSMSATSALSGQRTRTEKVVSWMP